MENIDVGHIIKVYFSVMIMFGVVLFPITYICAHLETNPNHRHYVPPEKRVWHAMTRGDFATWIFYTLFFPSLILIYGLITDFRYIEETDNFKKSIIAFALIASWFVASFIRNRIDKKY